MATFGQGINPQLGAIDYSPILRGSLAGAQMAAQGSQMIGQGLANLGQEIGQGVQKYFKEQEENTGMMGNLTATNPKTLIEASKDTRIAKALEGLKAGKSPKREDLIYATAKIANLEKNEARDYQRFVQQTEVNKVAEEKRIREAMPQLLRPVSKAEQMLKSGGSFADLANADKSVFNEAPVGAMEFLKRGMEQGIPVAILAPIANQLTEQSKVDAAASAPAKPGKVVDPFAIRSTDASGNPIDVIVDRFTGQEISRGPIATPPRPILTPNEQVDVAQRTAEVQGAAASANKTLDGLSVSALSADTELTKYSEIENLLNQNVETGFAQDYLTATRSLGQRAGFNDKDLANQQKLEALLSEDALLQTRNFLQGQGAVSDAERARIDKAALNSKKDKNALRELLGYRKAAAVRALAAQELRITLEDSGMGSTKIVRELNKWYRDNPFSAFIPVGGSHDFSAGNAVLNK